MKIRPPSREIVGASDVSRMPRTLSIARENGNALRKTYGLHSVHICRMKFSLTCVVIALSCSASVWADLEFYPGLKLGNGNSEDSLDADEGYYYGDSYRQWPNDGYFGKAERKEPHLELSNADKWRQIEKIIAENARISFRNHPPYENSGVNFIQEDYKQFKDFPVKVEENQDYGDPQSSISLDDVRMYPQEDDFSFKEDSENKYYDNEDSQLRSENLRLAKDEEENPYFQDKNLDRNTDLNEEIEEPLGKSLGGIVVASLRSKYNDDGYIRKNGISRLERNFDDHRRHRFDNGEERLGGIVVASMGTMGHHPVHKDEEYKLKENEEFGSNRFKNVPVVEDPTEFAYAPPDPRFYEKDEAVENEIQPAENSDTVNQEIISNNKFQVKNRSDQQSDEDPDVSLFSKSENLNEDTARNRHVDVVAVKPEIPEPDTTGMYIIAVFAGISAAATVGMIAVAIGWYNLQRHIKYAEETDYPSYGIVGPNKDYDKRDRDDSAGDRRLAQSAQMYHYQHQKQQIIAMGRNPPGGQGSASDTDEEEDEEGNYTVYECPGLASIEGPLEVRNPMFDDDQLATPTETPTKPNSTEDPK